MSRRALVLLSIAALFATACEDDPPPAEPPPRTYAPMEETELDAVIDAATARAREHERKVLLDFGAEWCPDCREVLRLLHEGPAREVLESDYETVVIDVGRFDRHRALIDRFGIERIATLVVLDGSGQRVAQTTLEPITGDAEGLTADALAAWLRQPRDNWQPE